MELTGLNVHPLKSTASRSVTCARVLPRGLEDDRSWMVVDGDGVLVSAREEHRLLAITSDTPTTDATVRSALRLRSPGLPDLDVDVPSGPLVRARLHSRELQGVEAAAAAHDWLRAALGREDLRLVWCDDPTRRRLNPAFSSPGDHTAFADAYPVTIASEASLRQLDAWVAETAADRGEARPGALGMQRFRASLVVDGEAPFAEDAWTRVTVGDAMFRVAKPVDRCVITTIDLRTLTTSHEPIRTLARHRLSPEHTTLFAVFLVPVTTATIRVGDPVSAS